MIKKILFTLLLSLLAFSSVQAQTNAPEMADQMRADGKIYVVITVLALIFIALVVFLLLIERRVAQIEKELKKGNGNK